jgi:hypothetical protein
VNTESTNVGTRFTADPENTEMSALIKLDEFRLIDSTNTELTFDSRNERRTLVNSTGELFKSLKCQAKKEEKDERLTRKKSKREKGRKNNARE